jgi:hypothetical protein
MVVQFFNLPGLWRGDQILARSGRNALAVANELSAPPAPPPPLFAMAVLAALSRATSSSANAATAKAVTGIDRHNVNAGISGKAIFQ